METLIIKRLFSKFSIPIIFLLIQYTLYGQNDWLQGWRNATVAIGVVDTGKAVNKVTGKYIINSKGDTSRVPYFRVVGTGIITASPDTTIRIPLLLTAKHVFDDPKKKWHPNQIRIRFSWFSDKSVTEYFGVPLDLIDKNKRRLWRSHSDESVDLALIPLAISKKDAGRDSIDPVRIQDAANTNEAFEGASVLLLGYPGAVGIDYWTKPIVRHGIISHVDEKNFGKSPFLIDAMVFPGNSGGPVFIIPTGMTRDGSFSVGGRSAFLGIVSSVARQTIQVEKSSFLLENENKDTTQSHFKSFDYMGIGIIEPAGRVKELLESIK